MKAQDLEAITLMQFWFAADVARKSAALKPLGFKEARSLYLLYRADLVIAELDKNAL